MHARDTALKAQVYRLGWMTATLMLTKVVWCMGEVLKPRAWSKALGWCGDLKERVDNCDPTVSPKPHWWQQRFFLTNNDFSLGP